MKLALTPFPSLALASPLAALLGWAALGDVWFTHDIGVRALPPPPANGVAAQPDVQDVFFSAAAIRTAPGPNLGNALVLDDPLALGLQAGDHVDAVHHELRPLGSHFEWFPAFVFSVDSGSAGLPGTNVNLQAPTHAADLFESNGFGYQALDTNENQVGLAAVSTTDIDGFFLTPVSEADPGGWVYFSLTPGSPTLAALGASPADVLAAQVGGPPRISITALQLGLDPVNDDLDGLVMVGGMDVNDDGDFDDAGDSFPWVNFSVSPASVGLPGTAVRNEATLDPPVGGDIYFSLGFGTNNLFFDDGPFGLGLRDEDDVDGLDLPSLSVPRKGGGKGGLSGIPFSGGHTTPGAPGTPGGPPLPPPGGGLGGGPGANPVKGVRISLCKQAAASGMCTLTIRVAIQCGMARNCSQTVCVAVPCDDCDDSNGSEISQAVQAMAAALAGMKINCPAAGPDNGMPPFAGPGPVTMPTPGHATATLPVNGALTNCQVTSLNIMLNGCDCYTQDVAILSWDPTIHQFVESDSDAVVSLGIDSEVTDGVYLLQFGQNNPPLYLDVPAGSAADAVSSIHNALSALGYRTVRRSPRLTWILAGPDGAPITDVWACGFVAGGTGHRSVGLFVPNRDVQPTPTTPVTPQEVDLR